MNAKLQIVAKQSEKNVLSEELSRVSVCNNPTKPSWTVPDGSFVPSDFGVLMVVVNGLGPEEERSTIAELTLQAIKYSIHETSDDWDKKSELDVLESAIYFAHEQIITFKQNNPEYTAASANVSIGLIKNNKLYLSWIGEGGIYKYTERSFDIISGPNESPKLDLLTQISLINDGDEEPLVVTFDETLEIDSQYSDELGIPSYVPMIKTKVEAIYQNDVILVLTDGLAALHEALLLDIVENNLSSSNQIVQELLSDASSMEATIICKIVQGKRLVLPVRQSATLTESQLTTPKDFPVKTKKKSNLILNSFLLTLVLLIIVVWNFSDRNENNAALTATNINETRSEEKEENLILLMADESEFGLEKVLNKEEADEDPLETSKELETSNVGIVESSKQPLTDVSKINEIIKPTPKAEEPEPKKISNSKPDPVASIPVIEPTVSKVNAKLLAYKKDLKSMRDKVNIMMDWDEASIKNQKKVVLKNINEGISKIDKNVPGQEQQIEQIYKITDIEFRALQRLVSDKLYKED